MTTAVKYTDNDTNSADDGAEQQPQTCDWKNASGDDEEASADSESEKPVEPLPNGPDLSLRLPAFDSVFDDADAKLRDLSRAMKTKLIESGELSIKIVINNYGSILKPDPKKCKVECVPKPAKVSTQIRFPSDLEIAVEQDGRVIVPADRDQQLSFKNDSAPGGTVTVDGKTGVVEKYQEDGQDFEGPSVDEKP
jgi:hypothetical protein